MTQIAFDNRIMFRQIRPGDSYIRLSWKFIHGKHTWYEYFVDEHYRTAEQQADSFKNIMGPMAEFSTYSTILTEGQAAGGVVA